MYVLRTTLKQCDNLTIDILCNKLETTDKEVKKLVQLLHDENVIYYKYNYQCPNCKEIDTILEIEQEQIKKCSICGKGIDRDKMINQAKVRFSLDKEDFREYMEENYSDIWELTNRQYEKKGENIRVSPISIEQYKKDNEGIKGDEMQEVIETKLFISHAQADYDYVKCFVEFLEDIGMTNKNMFCSSISGYGIPWGSDIYEYLSGEFNKKELLVLFMLSENYYKSAPCLNEMGAAWIQKKEYRSVLLPGFEFKEIEGAINPKSIGFKFDNENLKYDLNEIRRQLTEFFGLSEIDPNRWDRIRDDFIKKIETIKLANSK